MPRGYPDYATPYGEVLTERGYIEYFERFSGNVNGGSYADLYSGILPVGYNLAISMASMSANGCEAYHMSCFYVNGVLKKAYYFEVNHLYQFPRYLQVSGGSAIVNRVYNYGDAARAFEVFVVGILLVVGTKPFKPKGDPGKPPALEADESLFIVETPWEGRVWRKVKNIPIPEKGWERYHPPLFLKEGVD